MAISITVANNADGSATVTVSGAGAGDTVEIRTLKIDELWGGNSWVARTPTRTGNGTVAISTGAGAYFFAAVAAGEWSPPVYRIVSATTQAVFTQILDAVVTRLRLLALDGVDSDNVTTHAVLTSRGVWEVRQPTVMVGPMDDPISQANDSGSTRNHLYYPTLISCLEPANRDAADSNRWFLWTQRIRNAFVDVPLQVSSGCVYSAELIPLADFQRDWWSKNLTAMFVGLRFRSSETRGMG